LICAAVVVVVVVEKIFCCRFVGVIRNGEPNDDVGPSNSRFFGSDIDDVTH